MPPPDTPSPIGSIPLRDHERNRLRIARTLARISQAELYRHTGVLQAQISAMELGRYRDVTLKTAHRLARFFGCTVEDLFPRDVIEDDFVPGTVESVTTKDASC